MRGVALFAAAVMAGCGPGIEPHFGQFTPEEMERRATLAFVGMIERHIFENQPYFRIPGDKSRYWKVLRREVRVETVIKGSESRTRIPVYEVFWVGGASGDWNSTSDDERYLFLVRLENGRYRVVQDWSRSIYPVHSGTHGGAPLSDSAPFWERVALLMWWVKPDRSPGFGRLSYTDPGNVLGLWRLIKLMRGLLHHPDLEAKLRGCENLLHRRMGQDECWDLFSGEQRKLLNRHYNAVPVLEAWEANRRWEQRAPGEWDGQLRRVRLAPEEPDEMDRLRLFTTVRDQRLREQFCRKFLREFPDETEHGCPAGRPRPATVVTADGDVPYPGRWPE
jgi:hypothetical protein